MWGIQSTRETSTGWRESRARLLRWLGAGAYDINKKMLRELELLSLEKSQRGNPTAAFYYLEGVMEKAEPDVS